MENLSLKGCIFDSFSWNTKQLFKSHSTNKFVIFPCPTKISVIQASGIIENILMRLPMPPLYLIELTVAECFTVIDGAKRLAALDMFLKEGSEHKFTSLRYFPELNKKTYAEIGRPMQRRIEEYMWSVVSARSSIPEMSKLDLIRRIKGVAY